MNDDSQHPNVAQIHRGLDAFSKGDLAAFLALYTDDPAPIYRVPGNNQVSGVHVGKDAITKFFLKLGEMTNWTLRVEAEDVMADDRHAFMMWRGTADRGDRHLDAKGAMAFKVTPEGKFSESWFLYDDQAEYDAFYS